MSNSYFQFKQFTVWHDQCAMKVGTDGTLLGAWAPVHTAKRVLDIGTGTGLIALMIAQRQPLAEVKAVDIDEATVKQAQENVAASPFFGRVSVFQQNILNYPVEESFDLIVCNPPYFQDALHCPDKTRTLARHNDSLPFDALCQKVFELLEDDGLFCVVLPADLAALFIREATEARLYLHKLTEVCTKAGKPVKRVLMSFSKSTDVVPERDILYMMDTQGNYTEAYRLLTGDFYLK